jgi:putative spermidine/putrescine transport system substrate-binding protein
LAKKRGYVVPTDKNVQYAESHSGEFDVQQQRGIAQNVLKKFHAMKGSVNWQNVRPREYKLYEEWWSRLRAA